METSSIVYNENCLHGLDKFDDSSIDFAIVDAPYDMYDTAFFNQLMSKLNDKLSNDSLVVLFTNNKFIFDCGYVAKMYFDYWFIQHWIYDDGYLIHQSQPKDASRSILYFRKGNPSTNIDALRGDVIKSKPINKGNKNRGKNIGRNYTWNPNEKGMHPKTYFYSKHTSEIHSYARPKPTGVKPLNVCHKIISFSNSNSVVDLFTGSGSFRIASNMLGKNYIGFEINDDFYNTQECRYNDYSSQGKLNF